MKFQTLSLVIWSLILSLPVMLAGMPLALAQGPRERILALLVAPWLYVCAYVVTCGVLSLPFQSSIRPGIFARDISDPKYMRRRLYGQCWTAVYYFTPLYNLCLSVPAFKSLLFWLFGYRGSTSFTIYPDTWIRDLPLLRLGHDAYLANGAVLGTNAVLSNGQLLVDSIEVGMGAMVGHRAMLAPGTRVGLKAEVGAVAICGVGVSVAPGGRVGIQALLDHGTIIHEGTVVGSHAYLGKNVSVAAEVMLPAGVMVPDDLAVDSQARAESLVSAWTSEVCCCTMTSLDERRCHTTNGRTE